MFNIMNIVQINVNLTHNLLFILTIFCEKCFPTSGCVPVSQIFASFIGQKKRLKRQRVKESFNPYETSCKRSVSCLTVYVYVICTYIHFTLTMFKNNIYTPTTNHTLTVQFKLNSPFFKFFTGEHSEKKAEEEEAG